MRTTRRLLREGWRVRQTDPREHPNTDLQLWLDAEVPGHVHLDLMRAGAIPDPFERMYERSVQWVDHADWTYRCVFDVDGAELDGSRHLLCFAGIDTVARILLNDEMVGDTDNMFVPQELDVTSALRGGENVLEVHLASAERVGNERRAAALAAHPDLAPFADGLLSRSFVRKSQYMYGWDWGPCLRGCGIWRDVHLVRLPRARVHDWAARASFSANGSCRVVMHVWVDGHASEVSARISGHGIDEGSSAALVDGSATIGIDVAEPERWWPSGYGEQPLYTLSIEAVADGAICDSLTARIGLRAVELVRTPDDVGERFCFRVNGVDVFAKGANWIPDDSFPGRSTRGRLHRQLAMARECGMNMVRVWGGGLYESEEFYDICDELGLMVWQDFPYACALYPEDDAFVAAATAEARAAVRRLRNHASLVLWCGNNENQWLAMRGEWGALPRVLGERLYDETLPAVVAEDDPGTPYWPGSPTGGSEPNSEASGNCHAWDAWSDGDRSRYAACTARFVSEFGFASPPALRTLQEVLAPEDLAVDTPGMRWHDKTSKGYTKYLGFIARHYAMPATVEDLVYYGQLNQADALRFGVEHFRRLRPHTMGTLVWQLNDCWPVLSWAWIDHRLRAKAVWYAAKRFYAPLLVSLVRDGDRLGVHLVNDDPVAVDGELVLTVVDADGTDLWRTERAASVDGPGSTRVLEVDVPASVLGTADRAIAHATFAGAEATALLVEPKDLRLPGARLTFTETAADDGSVQLSVASDVLAASLMLWLDDADATWSDNFFHLLPGRPRVITVTPWQPMSDAELRARLRWRSL
jgi:beta-mannosidase